MGLPHVELTRPNESEHEPLLDSPTIRSSTYVSIHQLSARWNWVIGYIVFTLHRRSSFFFFQAGTKTAQAQLHNFDPPTLLLFGTGQFYGPNSRTQTFLLPLLFWVTKPKHFSSDQPIPFCGKLLQKPRNGGKITSPWPAHQAQEPYSASHGTSRLPACSL